MRESEAFRDFVLDDYTKLLSGMFDLVEEIAFAPLEHRLARRLLVEADANGIVWKTHQQLASDIGNVREVVRRLLGEWADAGLVEIRRGQVQVADRAKLAAGRPNRGFHGQTDGSVCDPKPSTASPTGGDRSPPPIIEPARERETDMADASEELHVAWGASRAGSVRDALRLLGCAARVVALTHDLSIGPINPLDPDARRAWFAANTRADDEPSEELTDAGTPWIEATAVGVHPVYWACLTDASEHASLLEFVCRMAGRPFDIVDATGLEFPGASRVSPVWSLGQLRPEEIVASGLGDRRCPFTRAESEAAMADWTRLRRENAPLRVVRDGHLVSAPLTHFDAVLTGLASGERELLIKFVARVLHHLDTGLRQPGQGCGYELLFARVLALGEAGALEVTGPGPGMRDYRVRKALDRSAG